MVLHRLERRLRGPLAGEVPDEAGRVAAPVVAQGVGALHVEAAALVDVAAAVDQEAEQKREGTTLNLPDQYTHTHTHTAQVLRTYCCDTWSCVMCRSSCWTVHSVV